MSIRLDAVLCVFSQSCAGLGPMEQLKTLKYSHCQTSQLSITGTHDAMLPHHQNM